MTCVTTRRFCAGYLAGAPCSRLHRPAFSGRVAIRSESEREEVPMNRHALAALCLSAVAAVTAVIATPWVSAARSHASACGTTYAPVLDPVNFVAVVDNRYFPLPVGRTLVYTGMKDGETQTDTV